MSSTTAKQALDPSSSSASPATDPKPSKYIVDRILPVRRCHLVVGPSGAGKTRWLFPTIADLLEGKDLFERPSFPFQAGYVICDRPKESAEETIEMMGLSSRLPKEKFPIVSLMSTDKEFHYDVLPTLFPPGPRVLFVEALAALVPNGKINDYHSVLKFFKGLYKVCRANDLTIIGTVHQPKLREDESFTHPRDKVLGSVAWAACSDTVILIEPESSRDIHATRRRLTLLPRNEGHEEFVLDFNDHGHLKVINSGDETFEFLLEQELDRAGVDPFRLADWIAKHNIPQRAAEKWVSRMTNEGKVERIKAGTFQRRPVN